jgi:hypothetical protein
MSDPTLVTSVQAHVPPQNLPGWVQSLIERYGSNAANQFLLYGNIADSVLLRSATATRLGALSEFLLSGLLNRFDVVLSYDLGNGIRVEKGAELFSKWPAFQESQKDWKSPRPAVETLTRYFRYCANLVRLNQPTMQVGCIIKNADLDTWESSENLMAKGKPRNTSKILRQRILVRQVVSCKSAPTYDSLRKGKSTRAWIFWEQEVHCRRQRHCRND